MGDGRDDKVLLDRRTFLKGVGLTLLVNPIISPVFAEREERKIYLTIDDGPGKNMEHILSLLREEDRVSFFLVGQSLEGENGYNLACRALEKGHVLGNHSRSHPSFSKISVSNGKREIDSTDKLIDKVYKSVGIERKHKLFRFPYGDKGNGRFDNFLKEMGYSVHYWDVDSEDWKVKAGKINDERMISNLNTTKKGDVVLMHDLTKTAEEIISYYTSENRGFVLEGL
jgi:peptidoglycan/xylan/chitin deacetylase (PgdA/CDA1 family)